MSFGNAHTYKANFPHNSKLRIVPCALSLQFSIFEGQQLFWLYKQLGNLSEHAQNNSAWTRGNCVI